MLHYKSRAFLLNSTQCHQFAAIGIYIVCTKGMANQSFNTESITMSRCGSPPTTTLHQEDVNDDGKMSKLVTGVTIRVSLLYIIINIT